MDQLVVLIRGAGEMASGVAHRLHQSHFKICMTDISSSLVGEQERPSAKPSTQVRKQRKGF